MRSLPLALLLALLLPASARAASYQQTDGTIVEPILLLAINGGGLHPYTGPNLGPGAVLTGAALWGADLQHASLSGSDLSGASIDDANLDSADLSYVDMSPGNLTGTSLIGTDLTGADLIGVNLVLADLSGATLEIALLDGADFNSANLANASLSGASLVGANLLNVLYDENTIFPSGHTYYMPPWGLDQNASPWAAGMIPVPEPTSGRMLAFGGLALLAVTSLRSGI